MLIGPATKFILVANTLTLIITKYKLLIITKYKLMKCEIDPEPYLRSSSHNSITPRSSRLCNLMPYIPLHFTIVVSADSFAGDLMSLKKSPIYRVEFTLMKLVYKNCGSFRRVGKRNSIFYTNFGSIEVEVML